MYMFGPAERCIRVFEHLALDPCVAAVSPAVGFPGSSKVRHTPALELFSSLSSGLRKSRARLGRLPSRRAALRPATAQAGSDHVRCVGVQGDPTGHPPDHGRRGWASRSCETTSIVAFS